VYPTLFEIGNFQVSTFGVMMVCGFVAAGFMNSRAYEAAGIPREAAWDLLVWAMVGGVLGSKLWFVAETLARDPGQLDQLLTWGGPLLSRGGLTWYGGLLGGALAAIYGGRRLGIGGLALANASAPSLAVGQALGRVGCFLVGDDYGRPTDAAWGVAFPQGLPPTTVPVHPTQLYEVAWLGLAAWLLWRRRRTSPLLIAEYLALAGLGRLWIEVFRTNPALIGPLSNAQVAALACIAIGVVAWLRASQQRAQPLKPGSPA
jgi:phosphatidylglycerol:prolipoprotein diacylglycerol transferase